MSPKTTLPHLQSRISLYHSSLLKTLLFYSKDQVILKISFLRREPVFLISQPLPFFIILFVILGLLEQESPKIDVLYWP